MIVEVLNNVKSDIEYKKIGNHFGTFLSSIPTQNEGLKKVRNNTYIKKCVLFYK